MWGSNKYGQLGVGPKCAWSARPVSPNIPSVIFTCVAAGNYHSVAVDHKNRVWTWGWGIWGQLGYGGIENRFYPNIIQLNVSEPDPDHILEFVLMKSVLALTDHYL